MAHTKVRLSPVAVSDLRRVLSSNIRALIDRYEDQGEATWNISEIFGNDPEIDLGVEIIQTRMQAMPPMFSVCHLALSFLEEGVHPAAVLSWLHHVAFSEHHLSEIGTSLGPED